MHLEMPSNKAIDCFRTNLPSSSSESSASSVYHLIEQNNNKTKKKAPSQFQNENSANTIVDSLFVPFSSASSTFPLRSV